MSRSLASFFCLVLFTLVFLCWQVIGRDALHIFSMTYSFLMHSLQPLLHDHAIRQMVVVILASLLLGLVPAFLYWIIQRRWLYEYMTFVWCIWIVIMAMILLK